MTYETSALRLKCFQGIPPAVLTLRHAWLTEIALHMVQQMNHDARRVRKISVRGSGLE